MEDALAAKEKVVGVLGGMGPWATWAFCQKLSALTPAKKDWEQLRILVDCNVKIPSRTRHILYKEESPIEGMVESIEKLRQQGADIIAVPCNSAHYFYNAVDAQISVPWIHMIEVTAKAIQGVFRRPLVIGGYITTNKRTYDPYVANAVYPQGEDEGKVYGIIEALKQLGKPSASVMEDANELVERYKQSHSVDGLILACTELTLAINGEIFAGVPVIDSSTTENPETMNKEGKNTILFGNVQKRYRDIVWELCNQYKYTHIHVFGADTKLKFWKRVNEKDIKTHLWSPF